MPAFNAASTIYRSITSVIFQTYPNWKIIIRDDMSTDGTVAVIESIKKNLNLSDDKITLTVNTEKMWEVRNIVESLKETDSNDIICRLDGDDWLCDTDILTIIDHSYRTKNCDVLWTSHRWGFTKHNISGPMPKNADPYTYPWVSSHFKTFRKFLIENVSDENFRGSDGEYFKRIGDQAIYLPILYKAKGNWHHEPIVAYHYTVEIDNQIFQTNDALFQKKEAEFLRTRGFVS